MTIAAINGKELSSVNFDITGSLRSASSFLLSKIGDLYSYCVSSCFSRTEFSIQKAMKTAERKIASNPSLTEAEKEMIIDSEVAAISKEILANQKNHIIIRIQLLGGFGDLLFGLKLADTLVKNLPSIEIALVFLDDQIKQSLPLVQEYPHLVNCCYTSKTLPGQFKDPKSGICIGAASFYPSSIQICTELYLSNKYPFLLLPEYGLSYSQGNHNDEISFKNLKFTRVAGLARSEYGIFIDRRIKEAVEEDRSSRRDPLNHLHELSEGLRKEIIRDQSPPKYSSETDLYFGYGHSLPSQKHFIRLVAHLEKNKSNKNIDMLLILRDPDKLESIFDERLREELAQQGFGQIEITGSPSREPRIIKLKDSGRSLRIIPKKGLSHRDFETCLLMSQPLSLITGDQSLSEGISANKIFIYELFVHKILLAESFISLASELRLPLVEEYFKRAIVKREDLTYRESSQYDELATKFLLNEDFIKQWNIFIKHIQEKKSFNEKVVSLVGRRLASSYYPSLC
jgi:hypothetical protein